MNLKLPQDFFILSPHLEGLHWCTQHRSSMILLSHFLCGSSAVISLYITMPAELEGHAALCGPTLMPQPASERYSYVMSQHLARMPAPRARYIESQNFCGWKGPLEIIESNPLLKGGSFLKNFNVSSLIHGYTLAQKLQFCAVSAFRALHIGWKGAHAYCSQPSALGRIFPIPDSSKKRIQTATCVLVNSGIPTLLCVKF